MGERASLARIIRVAINGEEKTFSSMVRKLEDESQ